MKTFPTYLSFREKFFFPGHNVCLLTLEKGWTSASGHITIYLCFYWRQKILSPVGSVTSPRASLGLGGRYGLPLRLPQCNNRGEQKGRRPWKWGSFHGDLSSQLSIRQISPWKTKLSAVSVLIMHGQLICIPKYSRLWRAGIIAIWRLTSKERNKRSKPCKVL